MAAVVVIAVIELVVVIVILTAGGRPQSSGEQLHQAEQDVDDLAREARRAMNDAVGQSWRNLAD